jgi:hypothetical protein
LATGSALAADVFALHECDNPVCVKVSGPGALCEHVVAGTQFDNMRRMARARRRGGRPTIRGLGRQARRARSVPLREAVQGGVWDTDAVANALLGVEPRSRGRSASGGGKRCAIPGRTTTRPHRGRTRAPAGMGLRGQLSARSIRDDPR